MSFKPSSQIALSIAEIKGYLFLSLPTQSVITNLPSSKANVAPIEAPTKTAKDPTRRAYPVDLYAQLKAIPDPMVSIDPGKKKMVPTA